MTSFDNLLLISGAGRKTFKTTFACEVIRLHRNKGVVGVKISSHFHPQEGAVHWKAVPGQYEIYEESRPDGPRDSHRMLHAGAEKVYYIQCRKEALAEAFQSVLAEFSPGQPIVCESGGLADVLRPALHLALKGDGTGSQIKALHPLADVMIEKDETGFSVSPERIVFENGKWGIAA
ncbi:MAG: hypothetical protein IAE84_09795 [Saprospiraceae bacterium]|jgi:hypothetical protein|nr:hypothetical protein [Saprospiraceae bacterium]HRD79228.1 hypothetical protein [Saprospiraceae bacterium]